MADAGEKRPKKTYVYFIIIIAVASLATLLSTLIIYRNSIRAAEESLKLQALGIAASLEPSLQAAHLKEGLFKEIVTDSTWEGIAFIALYDKTGLTLLHSNENLVGRRIDSPEIKRSAGEDKPVFGHMTLGTGEEIFILNYPIHTPDSVKVLRLALHPYPAQSITRQASFQAISILVTVVVLWAMGFFFIKAVRRSDELTAMMAERERLAVIGEMAAVLAHEIRNPLGSIKGFAQYLEEKSTEGKVELGVIIDEARRLERLTEDLLLFAKPSEVRIVEFNLHELVNESVKAVQESERLKQTAIKVNAAIPGNMMMVSDREKLKQILSNVLQNAADAVNDGGLIELRAEQRGDKIIIIISDNGCGMDEGTRSMAFNSFFTTKAKGTGLGLAIVAKLAKVLGGHAELESETTNGTVFRIELPAALNKGRYE
jgi:two-component system, NtrC family, sensor histidine kinase HydH